MTGTTRRVFVLGTPAALLADGTAGADDELFAACQQEQIARSTLDHENAHPSGDETRLRLIIDAWDEALELVASITPRTPQGMRSKARVAHHALMGEIWCYGSDDWRDAASPPELLAMAVLLEVANAGWRD
jgi:hypothetical protein